MDKLIQWLLACAKPYAETADKTEMMLGAPEIISDTKYHAFLCEKLQGLEEIRTFIQKNPNVWNAWFLLGWGLRRIGRWADAEQAFNQSLNCGGENNCDTYNELAICLMEQGKTKEAKKSLQKALSINPENVKIISNLGYLSLKEGNIDDARKYFTIVLEYSPNDKIALSELAKLETEE